MIATMVGIVGILLLGSLFWSALGALVSALGDASQALPFGRPAPTRAPTVVLAGPVATPTPGAVGRPTATRPPEATARATATVVSVPTPSMEPTLAPTPTVAATAAPTAAPGGRAPWVLLPQPAPGAHVSPGALVIEARGRGDLPIAEIRLELDGAALPVAFEQRSDSIWRGSATAQVSAGAHTARAVVVDQAGRSGAFRWSFDAGP
jgi:hypothetical protein